MSSKTKPDQTDRNFIHRLHCLHAIAADTFDWKGRYWNIFSKTKSGIYAHGDWSSSRFLGAKSLDFRRSSRSCHWRRFLTRFVSFFALSRALSTASALETQSRLRASDKLSRCFGAAVKVRPLEESAFVGLSLRVDGARVDLTRDVDSKLVAWLSRKSRREVFRSDIIDMVSGFSRKTSLFESEWSSKTHSGQKYNRARNWTRHVNVCITKRLSEWGFVPSKNGLTVQPWRPQLQGPGPNSSKLCWGRFWHELICLDSLLKESHLSSCTESDILKAEAKNLTHWTDCYSKSMYVREEKRGVIEEMIDSFYLVHTFW